MSRVISKLPVAGIKNVKDGIYESKGQSVVFGVSNPFGSPSYVLAYRHRDPKPFGVVGRFVDIIQEADAESKLSLKGGEKAFLSCTGPSASIRAFYKYADVPNAEKVMVLKAYAKGSD